MTKLRTNRISVLAAVLLSGIAPVLMAQDTSDETACAQLLPAIESLKTILVQEARCRTAEKEAERMQVVITLLGLRYRNIEARESSLRSSEAEENDLRGAMAREQAQLEALDEAARDSENLTPDPERKARRAEIEATLKGLEERIKGLRERKADDQGQLALERHDIEKLEALVRDWLQKPQ